MHAVPRRVSDITALPALELPGGAVGPGAGRVDPAHEPSLVARGVGSTPCTATPDGEPRSSRIGGWIPRGPTPSALPHAGFRAREVARTHAPCRDEARRAPTPGAYGRAAPRRRDRGARGVARATRPPTRGRSRARPATSSPRNARTWWPRPSASCWPARTDRRPSPADSGTAKVPRRTDRDQPGRIASGHGRRTAAARGSGPGQGCATRGESRCCPSSRSGSTTSSGGTGSTASCATTAGPPAATWARTRRHPSSRSSPGR